MRRLTINFLCILLITVFPIGTMAAGYLAEADRLFDQGGLDNYKQAIDLYLKAINANPKSYEAAWKCARAHREYGDEAKKQNIKGWKDICAEYGKKGMQHAEKASELEPQIHVGLKQRQKLRRQRANQCRGGPIRPGAAFPGQ